MDSTQAHQIAIDTNLAITSSFVWNYVMTRISSSAANGGTTLIDPLAGLDLSVPLDSQTALYSALIGEGYVVTDASVNVPSGAFDGAPAKIISW